jgi:leader peptidase (prepilin peptidase)/N-methyltransferase
MLITALIFSYTLIFILLAALAYRDLKEYILPDFLNAALAISFIVFHTLSHWQLVKPLEALEGMLTGGGLLLIIRTLANRYYRQDSLGLGDVKLMAAAGIGLGFPNIFMALSIGAFAGIIHGFVMALIEKKKTNHKINLSRVNVPAGVGLTIGIAAVMVGQFGFEWLIQVQK